MTDIAATASVEVGDKVGGWGRRIKRGRRDEVEGKERREVGLREQVEFG
jgi:hypothetical protein